ncbi:unnamed protein product [Toxocara canis]|uniref:Tristetraprolin n=1 Tax=Toxocara canis TaxID=6265 RepID=A0A183UJ73_TOXCA|nr:unnamed protein product [Toxocara canis]
MITSSVEVQRTNTIDSAFIRCKRGGGVREGHMVHVIGSLPVHHTVNGMQGGRWQWVSDGNAPPNRNEFERGDADLLFSCLARLLGIPTNSLTEASGQGRTMSMFAGNTIVPEVIRTTNRSPTVSSALLPVPANVQQFILSNYAVDQNSTMFILADEPQRVYVQQSNSLRYVDLCCLCPSRIVPSSKLSRILMIFYGLERRKSSAYKTALCREFRNTGRCAYGSTCRFAHGAHELRLAPQVHPKYKTQLCANFSRNGRCPYGARCQFIHRPSDEGIPAIHEKQQVEETQSEKPIKIQASVDPSHLPRVRGGGSVSPVGVLTDILNNW